MSSSRTVASLISASLPSSLRTSSVIPLRISLRSYSVPSYIPAYIPASSLHTTSKSSIIESPRPLSPSRPQDRLARISRQFHSTSSTFKMSGAGKIAIIAGVGAGTGGEVAKRFAKHYPVYLLSRNPDNTTPLVKEIEAAGGKAYGISADVTSTESITKAFDEIKKHTGQGDKTRAAAAIYNASGAWKRAPFLELTEADYDAGYRGSGHGAFIYAQAALPLLLNAVEDVSGEAVPSDNAYRPPTLIFTGATASVKGSALFAAFSPGKWAVRALSQNLAREFGPKGVHVSHAIIDGVIDIPRTKEWDLGHPDGKIDPASIAETYFYLHSQPRTSFTWEVDIRPFVEKW